MYFIFINLTTIEENRKNNFQIFNFDEKDALVTKPSTTSF